MLATILRSSSGDGVEIIANKVQTRCTKKLFLQYIHIFSCESISNIHIQSIETVQKCIRQQYQPLKLADVQAQTQFEF